MNKSLKNKISRNSFLFSFFYGGKFRLSNFPLHNSFSYISKALLKFIIDKYVVQTNKTNKKSINILFNTSFYIAK